MSTSKLPIYTFEENYWAMQAKALSHPARIKIIQLITQHRGITAAELSKMIKLSRTSTHQHLQYLIGAKFVRESYEPHKYELYIDKTICSHFIGFIGMLE